jgi:DNA-binding winged helix-turn-helix (wHTH) protein
MKYAFSDFVFDSEQLILYKNNEVVACRHTETKLLALFLAEPQRVFSKDDILEQVWAGKVVSEQAVFQNISLLRALFGDNAIKTFSKKGYQWQLDVKPYLEPAFVSAIVQPETKINYRARRPFWIFVVLALIVLIMGGFLYWRSIQTDPQLTRIAILPLLVERKDQQNQNLNMDLVQPVWQVINQSKIFRPVIVSDLKDYDDFFYTPQKYFTQLSQQTHSNLVLVASVGTSKNNVFIRYTLKSEQGGWSAAHQAKTVPLLLKKLDAHIALIMQSNILNISFSDSTLINAKLKILHQQAPNDLVVLSHLASSEIQNGNANSAVLLADELAVKALQQDDKGAEGNSYTIAADAYISQGLYSEAEAKLLKASGVLLGEQDYRALNSMQRTYASLAFAKHDYELFKKSLITAIQFAQQAKDPLLEVSDSNYLSVVANKFGEKLDRQTYLDRAEFVLDRTHQSPEHYASVYFYAGMYAETEALAEKYYRKVLTVLPADQLWWERERAQVHLTELLIKQARWEQALELFPKDKPLKIPEELMVAKIYSAQQRWAEAERHGLNAYKASSLSGQPGSALDAALTLFNIYTHAGDAEKAQIYQQFLIREAKSVPYWIRFNKEALDKVGLQLEEAQPLK